MYGLYPDKGLGHFKKIVAGKQLWNYDNLEPGEKKLVLCRFFRRLRSRART